MDLVCVREAPDEGFVTGFWVVGFEGIFGFLALPKTRVCLKHRILKPVNFNKIKRKNEHFENHM